MDDMYRISSSDTVITIDHNLQSTNFSVDPHEFHSCAANLVEFEGGSHSHAQVSDSDMSDLFKSQIANHPRYPQLLSAYIDCQKVGAPPELTSLLEDIEKENYSIKGSCQIGADPELDKFMESYCGVLHRYKEELWKPFDEATTFFGSIESQLSSLCKGTLSKTIDYGSDEAGGTSEEELSSSEVEPPESQECGGSRLGHIKGMLLQKYSGYVSNLREELLKRRKKGKLPNDARMTLLAWWHTHYRWPYPTEEEKVMLSENTGLDQKQINNWFINQRKRHWKPSEDLRFALMDGGAGIGVTAPSYFNN